jgi:hypothetical protein
MKRLLAAAVVFVLGSALAQAQTAWYVNPTTGNNANTGQLPGQAFRSLGHALTVASPGDNVFLAEGTYSASETFPIGLRDGVRVSALGGQPVFDGNGTATLFNLAEDVTQETELSGVSMTDAATCFAVTAGRAVDGLVLSGCTFAPTATGFAATLSSGVAGQSLTLDECSFAATSANVAISIIVSDGTALAEGGVESCEILGVFNVGVLLQAAGDGSIGAAFAVARNRISGAATALHLRAEGAGTGNLATLAAAVRGNALTGANPAVDTGLLLEAMRGGINSGGRIASRIEFNEIRSFDVAVNVETLNNGISIADVISDFFGNVFAGSVAGVILDVTQPATGERNADPNFGGHPEGGVACLNTFDGFVTDFTLDLDQLQTLFAQFCWFDGGPSVLGGTVDTAPIFANELAGTPAGTLDADVEDQEVTIDAAATSGFVDLAGAGPAGQILVELDGVAIPQSDVTTLPLGAGVVVILPALTAGDHVLIVTNPGGQSGEFTLTVDTLAAGSDGSGCFVATAAHGDYDAPEVRELRALRDEYFAMSGPGRSFIRWYYREGPAAADWIAERPWARAGARVALQPAVWVAQALTGWNAGQRFAVMVLLMGASFAVLRRRRS